MSFERVALMIMAMVLAALAGFLFSYFLMSDQTKVNHYDDVSVTTDLWVRD